MQISFLHPSEFISEHPPPISHSDVKKNTFRPVIDNEHHNINDIQVEVECSQRQQTENTTMVSPVQTSTTIPEHPPTTSESEVQKIILRTISEGDTTEDNNDRRQPQIIRQSPETDRKDQKPHQPNEESNIIEKSVTNKEDNTKRKTTLNKDNKNQVLHKQVVLKPPKPQDNPKLKKEKTQNNKTTKNTKNTKKKTEKAVSTIPELFRKQHHSEKTTPTMSDCTTDRNRVQTSDSSPVLTRIGGEDTSTDLLSNLLSSKIKTTPDLAQGKKPEKLSISKQLNTNP